MEWSPHRCRFFFQMLRISQERVYQLVLFAWFAQQLRLHMRWRHRKSYLRYTSRQKDLAIRQLFRLIASCSQFPKRGWCTFEQKIVFHRKYHILRRWRRHDRYSRQVCKMCGYLRKVCSLFYRRRSNQFYQDQPKQWFQIVSSEQLHTMELRYHRLSFSHQFVQMLTQVALKDHRGSKIIPLGVFWFPRLPWRILSRYSRKHQPAHQFCS